MIRLRFSNRLLEDFKRWEHYFKFVILVTRLWAVRKKWSKKNPSKFPKILFLKQADWAVFLIGAYKYEFLGRFVDPALKLFGVQMVAVDDGIKAARYE